MTKMTLEKEISELKETKSQFEVQAVADKQIAKDTITELEREIRSMKDIIEEKYQDQVSRKLHQRFKFLLQHNVILCVKNVLADKD